MFTLKWGDGKAALILNQAANTGRRVPKELQKLPQVPEHLRLFFDAFWELTTERQLGFGVGPIPVTAILWYCQLNGYTKTTTRDMTFFIRRMDKAYLEWNSKQTNAKAPKSK